MISVVAVVLKFRWHSLYSKSGLNCECIHTGWPNKLRGIRNDDEGGNGLEESVETVLSRAVQ